MRTFKLAVSGRIEFDVKFSLNDAGKTKNYGLRMTALRQTQDDQQRDVDGETKTIDFFKQREVQLVGWIGDSPLRDDEGNSVPADAEALDALYDLVGGLVGLVLTGYLQANGARGRSGN